MLAADASVKNMQPRHWQDRFPCITVRIRSTLEFPPNFTRRRFDPEFHALQDARKSQAMATVVTQLTCRAYCLGLSYCVIGRTGLEDNDAFFAEAAMPALGYRKLVVATVDRRCASPARLMRPRSRLRTINCPPKMPPELSAPGPTKSKSHDCAPAANITCRRNTDHHVIDDGLALVTVKTLRFAPTTPSAWLRP